MPVDSPVVAITGASAGIGRATAIAFARRGWRVALVARGTAGLDAAKAEVERVGGKALCIETDVGIASEVDRAAHAVADRWSRIDVWINNAMLTAFGPAERVTAAAASPNARARKPNAGTCRSIMGSLLIDPAVVKPRDYARSGRGTI